MSKNRFGKFWNFDPWRLQFWPEPKNYQNDFEMIFRELSNAAFRFSLRWPGAEIMGGRSNAPPPPSRRWKIQRPSRARVKKPTQDKWCDIYQPRRVCISAPLLPNWSSVEGKYIFLSRNAYGCYGCRWFAMGVRFTCYGCPPASVGVLTPTVEYNSPPMTVGIYHNPLTVGMYHNSLTVGMYHSSLAVAMFYNSYCSNISWPTH